MLYQLSHPVTSLHLSCMLTVKQGIHCAPHDELAVMDIASLVDLAQDVLESSAMVDLDCGHLGQLGVDRSCYTWHRVR